MTKQIACLALAVTCIFSSQVFAGTGDGKVSEVMSVQGGVVIFEVATRSAPPTCAVYTNQFAIDTSTTEGKSIYALLLTAVNSGRSVHVKGTGDCSAWYDRETAQQLHVSY